MLDAELSMPIINAQVDNGEICHIALIEPEHVLDVWPVIEPHFKASLKWAHDSMTTLDLLSGLLAGRLYLLLIMEGDAIVGSSCLEVAELRDKRVCHAIHFAGRNLDHWVDVFMEVWQRAAYELGCDEISIKGRPGWARYAKKLGFEHEYTIMKKQITEAE